MPAPLGRTDDKLPFEKFTTENLRPVDQFEAWHDSISVIFEAERLPGDEAAKGFNASVSAYHLGRLVLTRVDFERQQFVRDRHRAAVDGLDHYLVQLYATGGLVGTADGRDRVLRAGDVQILDLSRPNATRVENSATISIVVPRDTLRESMAEAVDMHGLVLRGDRGAGGLLSDHMRSLFTRAETITAADASAVAQATTDMIAACFRGTAETRARAQSPLDAVLVERIKRQIAATLASPHLDPAGLCRTFRISRSQLYRLFEPLGGVSAYIQEQRLARAHAELAGPSHDHRRIYEIAFSVGFASEAHFRRAFGLTPKEVRQGAVREIAPVERASAADGGSGYDHWVRHLSHRGG